jgi:hypothetical protein
MPNNFKSYYEGTNGHAARAAGVYTCSNGSWSYKAL